MKRFTIALFGIALAAGCGQKATIADFNAAIKKPTATADPVTTSKAVDTSDSSSAAAGSGLGVPNFGFALPEEVRPLLALADPNGLDTSNAGIFDGLVAVCAFRPSLSTTVEGIALTAYGSALSSVYGGTCSASGSFKMEYNCTNNNKTLDYTFTYSNFKIECTGGTNANLTAPNFQIDGQGIARLGDSKDGTKTLIRSYSNFTGSSNFTGTKADYTYKGGGGVVFNKADNKIVAAAVFVFVDNKSLVITASAKDSSISRYGLNSGVVFTAIGADGKKVYKCTRADKVTTCTEQAGMMPPDIDLTQLTED